jgi:hypothetical protein
MGPKISWAAPSRGLFFANQDGLPLSNLVAFGGRRAIRSLVTAILPSSRVASRFG